MTFGLKLNGAHSSQKERQLQKSCVSFGEECINLIDSITEVPCIMQVVLLVIHNNLVCHQVEQSYSINQHTIHARITSVIPVHSQGKRKKAH